MANFQPMQAAKSYAGMPVPLERGIEAASQSYKIGALLVDSSGSLAVAGADPGLGTLAGLATRAATGTTGAEVIYVPLMPHIIFEATLDVAAGTLSLAQAHVNQAYGIGLDTSSGAFFIDQAETTKTRVRVVALKDAVGTTSGRVYCVFIMGATIQGVVPAS